MRFLYGVLLSISLSLLVLLTTLHFQLLDEAFYFNAFRTHNLYLSLPAALSASIKNSTSLSQDEWSSYQTIINNLSPSLTQQLVERNLSAVLRYLNGFTTDVALYLPVKELGIHDTLVVNDTLFLSSFITPEIQPMFKNLHDIGSTIFFLWILFFVLTIVLGILHFVTDKTLKQRTTAILFVYHGGSLLLTSVLVRYTLMQNMQAGLSSEPSWQLVSVFVRVLLPEITTLWVIIGLFLFLLAVILLIIRPGRSQEPRMIKKEIILQQPLPPIG